VNRVAFFLALLLFFPLASSVAAQDTGSILKRHKRATIDPRDGAADPQRVIYAYGACVAKWRRGDVKAFLATAPLSKEANRAVRRLEVNECLQGNVAAAILEFSGESLRGPLYKALYQ
jgi:hypothetical protein